MRSKYLVVKDLLALADVIHVDAVKPHDNESVEVHVRFVLHGLGPRALMKDIRGWISGGEDAS